MLVDRPDHSLVVWFREVRLIAKDQAVLGAWPRGEKLAVARTTAMSCMRMGWIERTVTPANYGEGYYAITEIGRASIQDLPASAFVTKPGRPNPSVKGESARILRALAARHDPERGWVFMAEAPVDGHAVDAWAINCFMSRGYRRVGYEIKVSRGDFLTEMRKPDKTKQSARFCSDFYFACPAGLLERSEIPDPYGLVNVFPDGRTRLMKKSNLAPAEPTWGLLAHLLRRSLQLADVLAA